LYAALPDGTEVIVNPLLKTKGGQRAQSSLSTHCGFEFDTERSKQVKSAPVTNWTSVVLLASPEPIVEVLQFGVNGMI
jgi:hypothetical protein